MVARTVQDLWREKRRATWAMWIGLWLVAITAAWTLGFWTGYKLGRYQDKISLEVQEARYREILDYAVNMCGDGQQK